MDLQKHFTDFRVKGRCLHELSDILIIVLLGTLADCSDFPEIEDYAKDKEVFLREELGLLLLGGIPSEDTLSRVVRFLKPTELEKSLRSACKEVLESVEQKHIRIDDKGMRGTIPFGKKHATVQLVSAWLSEASISFGQLQFTTKNNPKPKPIKFNKADSLRNWIISWLRDAPTTFLTPTSLPLLEETAVDKLI